MLEQVDDDDDYDDDHDDYDDHDEVGWPVEGMLQVAMMMMMT